MSGESSISESAAKIALPLGCAHQLPTIGSPATASATEGTGPRAEASTTPCFSTSLTQRFALGFALRAGLRAADLRAGLRAAARFAGRFFATGLRFATAFFFALFFGFFVTAG